MKYLLRPITIEAYRFTGDISGPLAKCVLSFPFPNKTTRYAVVTPNGNMPIKIGDYVVEIVQDEFWPCPAEEFERTYGRLAIKERA